MEESIVMTNDMVLYYSTHFLYTTDEFPGI